MSNFGNTPPMYQEQYPGSSSEDQVQAVLTGSTTSTDSRPPRRTRVPEAL